jgi:indoleamine 2,3-dioxygenase
LQKLPQAARAIADSGAVDVHPERGFLPAVDPLRELPPGFAAWEERARDLGRWIVSGRARQAIDWMPLLDPAALADGPELRRAMLLLSFLGHAYVWCGHRPAPRIPDVLAVPWDAVAERLGRPPVLSYASYALDNWRRLDRDAGLELSNLALLQNFTGGADEDWFVLVHVAIEAAAAPVLGALRPACAAAREDDAEKLRSQLECVAHGIERMRALLERMPEWCDPAIYYRRVRPWIHGWKDHPVLTEGVIYEGVARYDGKPVQLRGETGAQSPIVPALDAALGVRHADDPLRVYLREMRDYQPPAQRAFVAELEAGSAVRRCIEANREVAPGLVRAYDACLAELARFRSLHLEYAARYIHQQAPSGAANPTGIGTGGTPFLSYLLKHRDETERQRIGAGAAA